MSPLGPLQRLPLDPTAEASINGPTAKLQDLGDIPAIQDAVGQDGGMLEKPYDYEELVKRDKVNPDIFWLRDQSLEDSDDLATLKVLATEIADDLEGRFQTCTHTPRRTMHRRVRPHCCCIASDCN
jgi:hypothetical protein